MAQKKFSELEAGTVDGTSIFAQTKTEDGSLVSKSASSPSLAGYIGTSHQFVGLNTNAKNLVGAINEAAQSGGGASVVQLTQAEYDLLDPTVQANGSIYKITDNAKMYCLDEEYHAVKELTTAEYEALTTAQQNNGTIYIQTDAETTGSDIAVSSGETETIAEAIDALSALSRYSATSSVYGSFSFKEINNTKFVLMRNLTGLAANALTTLDFTLPENFRPIEDVCYFDVRQPSSDYTVRLILNPSGVVQIYNYGSTTGALNVSFIGSYI